MKYGPGVFFIRIINNKDGEQYHYCINAESYLDGLNSRPALDAVIARVQLGLVEPHMEAWIFKAKSSYDTLFIRDLIVKIRIRET